MYFDPMYNVFDTEILSGRTFLDLYQEILPARIRLKVSGLIPKKEAA